MKLTGARIEAFLRSPDPRIIAVLIYGPDQGLVRERAERLVSAVSGDAADPFRVADLPADQLKDDRARLADEVAALPFSGGRRVVRIRDAKDTLVAAVRNLLEIGTGGGFVVAEAGELGPRSSLRQLFEAADAGAALPCYLDEGETLRKVIADELASHGLVPSEEASELLAAHLGADRGLTRRELEKLALYMGGPGRVELEDVLAIVGDAGATSLDDIVFAAFSGNFAALDHGLAVTAAEGVSAIALLRAGARHVQRLLQARTVLEGGGTAKQALDSLRPAVFFRQQPQFRQQLQRWPVDALATALLLVTETELACKQTGAPHNLLSHRALFSVAERARGLGR